MINIKADSRKIKEGDIFIALRGFSSDGHEYIDKAISMGASKLIVMDEGDYSIPYEVVPDTRVYLTNYLKDNYGKYLDEMNIVGITGTNGKTTSAYLLYDALNKLGIKCGYIGTVGFYLKQGKVCDLPNTSPDICDLYEMIIDAYDSGYRNMVIEASSQGLVRGRLDKIPFSYAVFSNLTQDHLDEHKTMDNYAKAKRILFDLLRKDGIGILNYDDEYKKYFVTDNTIYYGFNDGDYKVTDTIYHNQGTTFNYIHNGEATTIESPLLGDYNIYNLLSIIIILEHMNIPKESIIKVVKKLSCPPGRMDIIKYRSNSIIVDYAHTPDAISKILSTVKNIKHNNIYAVFGCTGSRDRTKRPIMMRLVTDNCKKAVVTMDDPHEEDPMDVVKDMLIDNINENYEVIIDREKAIERGISLLEENDILLVLGKGHEEFIIMKDKKIPFNDKECIKKIINKVLV
ncbi:MAG: UDP-N-acetylmuramoyl-L-alanyl-D-glutamate--2,6-diaminopimelate ligase [Bacilli bacterium]|nr:UDP-N-acetylmuramoyl-L-alanyl-D-glutamate--2,6-diaminopimelate ligase [Bacilli bacterium]